MNSGLQERVALEDGGLLLDTLELREGDCGIPEVVPLFDILAERLPELVREA
jgi:hypothetical protein